MRKGFTLIELLVVITIIVVLLALLTPALDNAMTAAEDAACGTNQRGMMTAMNLYAVEHTRHLPLDPPSNWPHFPLIDMHEGPMRPYYGTLEILLCPSDPYENGWGPVWWNGTYGRPMNRDDHRHYRDGDPEALPLSYYWHAKMYWAVDSQGVLVVSQLAAHKINKVRYPANLIAATCIASAVHAPRSAPAPGQSLHQHNVSAFLDGHREWVNVDDINPPAAYSTPDNPNLDWTRWGFRGRDFGGLAPVP